MLNFCERIFPTRLCVELLWHVRQRWCGVRRSPDKFECLQGCKFFLHTPNFFCIFFYSPDRQRTFPNLPEPRWFVVYDGCQTSLTEITRL